MNPCEPKTPCRSLLDLCASSGHLLQSSSLKPKLYSKAKLGNGDNNEANNPELNSDEESSTSSSSSATTSTCTSSSATSDAEDECEVPIRAGDSPKEAFMKYIESSNLVDLFETLLNSALLDDELIGKQSVLPELLAKKFEMKLPIQCKIEAARQINSQLRQQVMKLQTENKRLKTRLDCFEDPKLKLDSLKAKLEFDQNRDLVPVCINKRQLRTDPVTPVPSSMSLAQLPPPEDTLRVNTFIETENSRMDAVIQPHVNQQYIDYLAQLNFIDYIHCCAEFDNVLYFVVADRQTRFVSHLSSKSPEEGAEPQPVTALQPEHCQNVVIIDARFSPDGSMLACSGRSRQPGFSNGTSPPRSQLFFFDLASRQFLDDVLDNVTTFAFASNGGLVYVVPKTSSSPALLNLHSFGIPQDDIILANFEDFPDWTVSKLAVTPDNLDIVLILTSTDESQSQQVLRVPLDQTVENPGEFTPCIVVPPRDCGSLEFVHAAGSLWYFITTSFAPTGRIFSVDTAHAESSPRKYQDVVCSSSAVMEWAVCLLDKFVICYCESGLHSLAVVPHVGAANDIDTTPKTESGREIEKIPLQPGTITAHFFSEESLSLIFQFSSFLIPAQIYRLQLLVSPNSGQTRSKLQLLHEIPIPNPHSLTLSKLSTSSPDRQQTPNLILIHPEIPNSSNEEQDEDQLCMLEPSMCLLVPQARDSAATAQFSPLLFAIADLFEGLVCLVGSDGQEESVDAASEEVAQAAQHLQAEGLAKPETTFLYGPQLPSAHLAAATLNRRPDLFAGLVMKSGFGDHGHRLKCFHGESSKTSIGVEEGDELETSERSASVDDGCPFGVYRSGEGPPTSGVKLTASLADLLGKREDLKLLPKYEKFLKDLGYGSRDKADNMFLKVYDREGVNPADFQIQQEADILAFIARVINHGCIEVAKETMQKD